MRARWWRKLVGRSLLRERAGRRPRPVGECPSCGEIVQRASDCWIDADLAMTEHWLACAARRLPAPDPLQPRRIAQTLRVA
jgi:hypothetical protein